MATRTRSGWVATLMIFVLSPLCFDGIAAGQLGAASQQSPDSRDSLVLAAIEQGRWDTARQLAEEWVAADPSAAVPAFVVDVSAQARGEEGQLRRTQYDFPYTDNVAMKNVQTWTLKALQREPENANLLVLAGMVYSPLGMEDNTELMRLFEKARAASPDNAFVLTVLGSGYGAQAKYERAIDLLLKATQLNPKSSEAYTNLGTAYLSKGDLTQAQIAFRKAVEVNDQDGMAWFNLGSFLSQHGRPQDAQPDLEKAVALSPKLLEARWNLGGIYFNSGNRAKAVEQLREMIKIAPESAMGRQASGMLRQLGQ
jgi:tetratricopeptide (TPR) repeat protein